MKELTIVHALCVTRLKVGNEHAFHKTFIVCIGFRVRVTEINVDISCLMELRSQFHRAQRSSFKVQEISFTEEGRQNAKKPSAKHFICLTEETDKDERKENIQLNMDVQEQSKNNVNSVEGLPSKSSNSVIRYQDLRAVHCVTSAAEPSVQDSPVKSLRKWVDGCFHNTPANLVNTMSPVQVATAETPPSTPTNRSSTEMSVISSGTVC